jgi:DNA-binding ferritin-like protein
MKLTFRNANMKKLLLPLIVLALSGAMAACQSAYYGISENLGYAKREILVDRVEDSRDAQQEAQEQFQSALEQLSELVNFDGGDLEDMHSAMESEYEDAVDSAEDVRDRINAVDHVANAMFDEWEDEIGQYTNTRLKADSQAKFKSTQRRYDEMIKTMRKSEAKMEPVLAALKDNVMYLKHNLNARAVASVKVEFGAIEDDIESLLAEMRRSIASSDEFIASMQ